MTKAEYIARFGIERYQEKLAKDREYNRTHKEEHKKWLAEHKEHRIRYMKQYLADNKTELSNKRKIHYLKNSEAYKKYRQEHKEEKKVYNQEYHKTIKGRANNLYKAYKRIDKTKNYDISNNITPEWIVDNILSGQKCIYCGDQDWTHLGCDRIDNNKPHTADNIVCSCSVCNAKRADKYTVEEFKKYRALHPRACDVPKGPSIELSPSGALKKKSVPI